MITYPIKTLSLDEAQQMQFKLIDEITEVFSGTEILNLGDLGVVQPLNQPHMTQKIEQVLARFFNVEAVCLVRGAGTGALRYALTAVMRENRHILVHDAPIYPTTQVTLEMLQAEIIKTDFNNLDDLTKTLMSNPQIETVLVQYTRQKPDDSYDYEQVIEQIKKINSKIKIITDDNYAALKVQKLGASFANAISTFSSFKVQGPEGIGVILGSTHDLQVIRQMNYSGGCQVQGYEAHECLRGLINAPVMLAIQANVVASAVKQINDLNHPQIKEAFVANAQSKVIIVQLNSNIAKKLLIECEKLGACPNPVGAESKYEFVPMFYKVSGTFIKADPASSECMIRINPMRSGVNTVIKILSKGLANVSE